MNTKMTIAMERLAVLAAVTLPITTLASVYGMNVIVNDRTEWVPAHRRPRRDAGHQRHPAALDQAPGLVVMAAFRGRFRFLPRRCRSVPRRTTLLRRHKRERSLSTACDRKPVGLGPRNTLRRRHPLREEDFRRR